MKRDEQPIACLSTRGAGIQILVEWPNARGGIEEAGRGDSTERMKKRAQKALNLAMGTIRAMAYRVAKTINTLEDKARPDEAEVEFGITLDAEAGALLAKASTRCK